MIDLLAVWEKMFRAFRQGTPAELRFLRKMAYTADGPPGAAREYVREKLAKVRWRVEGSGCLELLRTLDLPGVAEVRFVGIRWYSPLQCHGVAFHVVETFPEGRRSTWILAGKGAEEDLFQVD